MYIYIIVWKLKFASLDDNLCDQYNHWLVFSWALIFDTSANIINDAKFNCQGHQHQCSKKVMCLHKSILEE